MSTVIETLPAYFAFLKYDRHIKDVTLRKVDLSIRYFTDLYGFTETTALRASDMYIFYEWLKNRACQKGAKRGELKPLSQNYTRKIMSHLKAFVKWLRDNAYTDKLAA